MKKSIMVLGVVTVPLVAAEREALAQQLTLVLKIQIPIMTMYCLLEQQH